MIRAQSAYFNRTALASENGEGSNDKDFADDGAKVIIIAEKVFTTEAVVDTEANFVESSETAEFD